ncbi:uncharacterized protein LOC119393162 isoform X2 [Rhipicephalus sanguineus]|uniref:uncharacterized protein LOC119393162 isoform X2 n=1 Tax=Rhipicephalus sanguineus TaxID=34632 RepID=UPI0018935F0F|nr:uncharacterized protein LOC119393162 isoform X2 [Rhipicephalus sanguineus]
MDLAENLAPCTYNQGGTCFIFDQLNDINGLLRQVKLELRETSPGTLSLTQAPHLRLGHGMMSGQNAGAWHLLDAVLQQHLCVISICIDERKEPTGIPIDIIIRKKNSTIRTLLLSTCLCYLGDYMGHGTQLAACLVGNKSLRTLILDRCCFDCVPGLQVIMDTLRCARQLVTLYLIGFNTTKVFAEVMPLIIINNQALRNLKVVHSDAGGELCQCYLNYKCVSCEVDYIENDAGNVNALTRAIPHNQQLQLLTVDLSKSSTVECRNFFEAVRRNNTLRKVTVVGLRNEDAPGICQMIRECGIADRVLFQCQLNVQEPVEAVIKCRKLSSISINAVLPEYSELLSKSLTLLPFWSHTTELSLSLSSDGLVKGHRLFLRYLEQATKLRSLKLRINEPVTIVSVRQHVRTALLGSLSIRKLHIDRGLVANLQDARLLAGELSANKRLHEFALFCDSELSLIDEFLRILAYSLEANNTLCWIHHTEVFYTPHYNAVQNLLRRNRAMSMCAAHFVVGTKQNQRCAEAFQRVCNTPGLLAYVMETASIGEFQAAFAIRAALSKNGEEDKSF